MNKLLTFLFVFIFSISGFTQGTKCKEGVLSFSALKSDSTRNYALIKDGSILPVNSLQKLFCINHISSEFSIKPLNDNELEITHLGMNTTVKMRIEMLKSKANFSFCIEEFTDKLTFFFLNDMSEVVFNSNNGIPFLTFTRLE